MAGGNGLELQQRNTNTPYGPAAPGWSELLSQMGGVFTDNQNKFNNYKPNTAGLGITTPALYGGLRDRVQNTRTAGETNLGDYASGKMLGANPYTDPMIQQNADEAMRRAASGIGAMGRGGSGLARRGMAETYARTTTPYYQQQYENDANRQFQANQMLDSNHWQREGMLGGLLNSQTAAEGAQIAGEQAKYGLETADPRFESAQKYAGILSGATPFATQETLEPPPSPLQMILSVLGTVGGLAGSLVGGDQQSNQLQGGTPNWSAANRRPREGILAGYG